MKQLIIIIYLFFIFNSCYFVPTEEYSFDYEEVFSSPEEAQNWVVNNIIYSSEKGDEWQLPEETYFKKAGDCEDKALLLMCFFWDMEYTPEMVIIKYNSAYHAIVKINDIYYDSTSTKKWDNITYSIVFTYSYAGALYEAEIS